MPHIRVRSYLHSEDGGRTFFSNAVIGISEYQRHGIRSLQKIGTTYQTVWYCNLEYHYKFLHAMMIITFR
jgi:hypothetical protein